MSPVLLREKETRRGRFQTPIKITNKNLKYNSAINCADCGNYFLVSNKELESNRVWMARCPHCLHMVEFEHRKLGSRSKEVHYHNI